MILRWVFHQIKNLEDATDNKDAVTYGQVKEELEGLRDDILGGSVSLALPAISQHYLRYTGSGSEHVKWDYIFCLLVL